MSEDDVLSLVFASFHIGCLNSSHGGGAAVSGGCGGFELEDENFVCFGILGFFVKIGFRLAAMFSLIVGIGIGGLVRLIFCAPDSARLLTLLFRFLTRSS